MNDYVFPGFPVFLARAAEQLGVDATATAGTPPAAIASLANLCAQAALSTEDKHALAILDEAALHANRLLVASEAAQMMLDEVRAARVTKPPVTPDGTKTKASKPLASLKAPSHGKVLGSS